MATSLPAAGRLFKGGLVTNKSGATSALVFYQFDNGKSF
jgi:hypothetical protein